MAVLVAAVVAGSGACGSAGRSVAAERFTQGGVSMEPTVKAGQVITVRMVGAEYIPRHGDIVLLHAAGGQWGDATRPVLKRVIAVGGETIACCDSEGNVTLNGRPLDEPYVANDSPLDVPPVPHSCASRQFGPVDVATGTIFVLGDNRAMSYDSRCLGAIPATSVFAVMIS